MQKHFLYLLLSGLFLLTFSQCAKRGTPSGGAKDTLAPKIIKAQPENFSTQFKGNEIRIYFNEYIKLKNISKELIVSPPLKYTPVITPLSTSKLLKIKLLDTLLENTTYSFNFGKSIVDNTEENPLPYFKYVFSTGNFIDSLKLRGTVKDILLPKPEKDIAVLLYEVNENITDSIVYKQKPTYVTIVKDSTGSFTFENLKQGRYLLTALKDVNSDYIFQPKKEKIGFLSHYITLPTDSTYTLNLFKEKTPYAPTTPTHISKNHILFGYQGSPEHLELKLMSPVSDSFVSRTYYDLKKDTLHYWFKPAVTLDTLTFIAKEKTRIDTLFVRMKDLYKDSLKVVATNAGVLQFKDSLKLVANTPIAQIALDKILVTDKDTLPVSVSQKYTPKHNILQLYFPKEENQKYRITLLPGAITDFFGANNDTLQYRVSMKSYSDFGSITLTVKNNNTDAIIVQLINKSYEVVSEKPLSADVNHVTFNGIIPGTYYIRLLIDANKNGKWDTGSFLNHLQPEQMIYYPSALEVRPNWSLQETFLME